MPVYNEDPSRVFGAAVAMLKSLAEQHCEAQFDYFVLSDSDDPKIWGREERDLIKARSRVSPDAKLYYRRRASRDEAKAGNIAEWCSRWGGAYDFMVVVDADSLLSGKAMKELADTLQSQPSIALIQTPSRQPNRETVFGRSAQFANHLYDCWAPMCAWGKAIVYGSDSSFWGHNAILRLSAFLKAGRLPVLSGKPPLGGYIISHDFVEAAILHQQGWDIVICPEITESYEEAAPSLVDWGKRERRWCQGNLQHIRLLSARGLGWSRIHLMIGLMYMSTALLWTALAILILIASYLQDDQMPWAKFVINIGSALIVLAVTPKLLAALLLVIHRETRHSVGGFRHGIVSIVFEAVIATLLAPARILIRTSACFSVLSGGDSGWCAQHRSDDALPLREVIRYHAGHTLAGTAYLLLLALASQELWLYALPLVSGLVAIIPLSALTGCRAVDAIAKRLGLFMISEDVAPPKVLVDSRASALSFRAENI